MQEQKRNFPNEKIRDYRGMIYYILLMNNKLEN